MKNIFIPQSTSRLSMWLYYLQHLHTEPSHLGLNEVRHMAASLNLLHPAPWVITVGGTNGKSTTCRLLETILLTSGVRVGVYSSPHLLQYTERVRIQGKELSELTHSKAMAIIEANRNKKPLSYFSFCTLAALKIFQHVLLDVVILEVGLGGRLDATNIIDADISVITSIALDHNNLLGSDRDSIAWEKAGIFRCGKPAIIGEPDPPMTLNTAANSIGAVLYARNKNWWLQKNEHNWNWWDNECIFEALPFPIVPLENAATVLAIIRRLPFKIVEKAIRYGLSKAELPGRFQFIGHTPLRILDVAHNPHAATYLAKRLKELPRTGKIRAVVGMLTDKDIPGTLTSLKNQVDVWYCASMDDIPRGESSIKIANHLRVNTRQFNDIPTAWYQAIADANSEDFVLVFGSFHAVASVILSTKQ